MMDEKVREIVERAYLRELEKEHAELEAREKHKCDLLEAQEMRRAWSQERVSWLIHDDLMPYADFSLVTGGEVKEGAGYSYWQDAVIRLPECEPFRVRAMFKQDAYIFAGYHAEFPSGVSHKRMEVMTQSFRSNNLTEVIGQARKGYLARKQYETELAQYEEERRLEEEDDERRWREEEEARAAKYREEQETDQAKITALAEMLEDDELLRRLLGVWIVARKHTRKLEEEIARMENVADELGGNWDEDL